MSYYYVQNQLLERRSRLSSDFTPLPQGVGSLSPPAISAYHEQLHAWGATGKSPGPVLPERVWVEPTGGMAFLFSNGSEPRDLMQVGLAPDLAAWLVLLDKWMATHVVIARARAVWTSEELAGALSFLTPAYLPKQLDTYVPGNWTRVAAAIAAAIADGPLSGGPRQGH